MTLIKDDTLANHGGSSSNTVRGEALGFDNRCRLVLGVEGNVFFLKIGKRKNVREWVAEDGGRGPCDQLGVTVLADDGCVDCAF